MNYTVLLYYTYVELADPTAVMLWQKALCERLSLKGRIVIAHNGINGTIEGTTKNTKQYSKETKQYLPFSKIVWKKSEGTGNAFPKLQVRVRKDLVSDHTDEWGVDPNVQTGKYLSASELHDWIHSGKKFYIMDMRNNYEHKSGAFEGSILPDIDNFRDLPNLLPELKKYNDRPIVTVCTGGIRCERASGLLLKHGFHEVYQLKDGIVTYMENYPNEDFKGKLYVFDNRLVMGFDTNSPKHEVIGKCFVCNKASENYVNCSNNRCHRHFICCEDCLGPQGTILCPHGCRVV